MTTKCEICNGIVFLLPTHPIILCIVEDGRGIFLKEPLYDGCYYRVTRFVCEYYIRKIIASFFQDNYRILEFERNAKEKNNGNESTKLLFGTPKNIEKEQLVHDKYHKHKKYNNNNSKKSYISRFQRKI